MRSEIAGAIIFGGLEISASFGLTILSGNWSMMSLVS
jgi:hypothetical protein